MKEAQRLSGLKTKRAVVDAALQALSASSDQQELLNLAGKVEWDGNIDDDMKPGATVILVDSSVWIDHLRGALTRIRVLRLRC